MIDNSKVFAVRIPPRGVSVLEKAIEDSDYSQSQFFRIALEALVNGADISAASFRNGEQAGLARAGGYLRGSIANLTALADQLEKKADSASGVESVAFSIDDDGDGDDG